MRMPAGQPQFSSVAPPAAGPPDTHAAALALSLACLPLSLSRLPFWHAQPCRPLHHQHVGWRVQCTAQLAGALPSLNNSCSRPPFRRERRRSLGLWLIARVERRARPLFEDHGLVLHQPQAGLLLQQGERERGAGFKTMRSQPSTRRGKHGQGQQEAGPHESILDAPPSSPPAAPRSTPPTPPWPACWLALFGGSQRGGHRACFEGGGSRAAALDAKPTGLLELLPPLDTAAAPELTFQGAGRWAGRRR